MSIGAYLVAGNHKQVNDGKLKDRAVAVVFVHVVVKTWVANPVVGSFSCCTCCKR